MDRERQAQTAGAPAADSGEHGAASGKLADLMKRAQSGDHRAMLQLRRIQARRRKQGGNVSFTDAEAGTIEAGALASSGGGAEAAVEAGATDRLEEHEGPENESEEGRKLVQDGTTRLALDVKEGAAGQVAGRLVLVPHIVELIRAGKYRQAVQTVADSVGVEDRIEIIKLIAERVHLSEAFIEALKWATPYAMAYDVAKLGWEWTIGGIKAVQEAHERGDRDSRIGIYAWAWADCVLQGHHSNPGAVTREQREAMAAGIQDGLASRELSPELGDLMLAKYGSYPNAKRALEDAMLARAGFTGIRTHA